MLVEVLLQKLALIALAFCSISLNRMGLISQEILLEYLKSVKKYLLVMYSLEILYVLEEVVHLDDMFKWLVG